jgi:hypothetical protein
MSVEEKAEPSPKSVKQVPEPLSPRNRTRVPKVSSTYRTRVPKLSTTYRSHSVLSEGAGFVKRGLAVGKSDFGACMSEPAGGTVMRAVVSGCLTMWCLLSTSPAGPGCRSSLRPAVLGPPLSWGWCENPEPASSVSHGERRPRSFITSSMYRNCTRLSPRSPQSQS